MSNVRIKDLLAVLNRLSASYTVVDLIIDPEAKTVIIDPVEEIQDDSELTDENIYKLI